MATQIPGFSYTGTYTAELLNGYWVITLLTSGELTMQYDKTADVFLLGAGAGGGCTRQLGNGAAGGGGGAGYRVTQMDVPIEGGAVYSVHIGAGGQGGETIYASGGDGEATSAFGYTANGGTGGGGGSWLTGGAGGTGGANGGAGASSSGQGAQGAGGGYPFDWGVFPMLGGGGSGGSFTWEPAVAGGLGGGGAGGRGGGAGYDGENGESAAANTGAGGGGGGGGYYDDEFDDHRFHSTGGIGGDGGSGIIILRGLQDDSIPVRFNGTLLQAIVFNGAQVKSLIYNGTKLFIKALQRRLAGRPARQAARRAVARG